MFSLLATGDTQPPTAGLQDAPGPGPASGASTALGAAESDGSNLGSDVGSISRHPSTGTSSESDFPDFREIRKAGFSGFRKLPLSAKNIFIEMGRGVAMKSQMVMGRMGPMKSQMGLSWHAIELS